MKQFSTGNATAFHRTEAGRFNRLSGPGQSAMDCWAHETATLDPRSGSALDTGAAVSSTDRLGLGGSPLAQIDGEDRHRCDSQKLRLPVLQRPAPEVR